MGLVPRVQSSEAEEWPDPDGLYLIKGGGPEVWTKEISRVARHHSRQAVRRQPKPWPYSSLSGLDKTEGNNALGAAD
jgi:hypothetical protein